MLHSTNPAGAERLPCRGCTYDCPNYTRCEGKPWLLREALAIPIDETHSLAGTGFNKALSAGSSLAP